MTYRERPTDIEYTKTPFDWASLCGTSLVAACLVFWSWSPYEIMASVAVVVAVFCIIPAIVLTLNEESPESARSLAFIALTVFVSVTFRWGGTPW